MWTSDWCWGGGKWWRSSSVTGDQAAFCTRRDFSMTTLIQTFGHPCLSFFFVAHAYIHGCPRLRPLHHPLIPAGTYLSPIPKGLVQTHNQGGSTGILSQCVPANSCLTPEWNSHHIHCVKTLFQGKFNLLFFSLSFGWALMPFTLAFQLIHSSSSWEEPFLFFTSTTSFMFKRQMGVRCK